jgi:circadian clock protein KaiC
LKRSDSRPAPIPRLKTGIPHLDVILSGGFLTGGSYIIAGAPGAGKTILGNQICFHHVASGERAVYITLLAESHGRMIAQLSPLSFFDPSVVGTKLYYVSGYNELREGKQSLKALLALVRKLIKRHGATLLVIDGIVRIGSFADSPTDFKEFIHELNVLLSFTGCTGLLLSDSTAEDVGHPARTMVDGLVELRDVMDGVIAVRELVVLKFRGTAYLRGAHFFEIDGDGLRIYARVEARLAVPSSVPAARGRQLSLGVAGLDPMMGGGVPEGTATLVLGSSGTGKTILGLHFLAAGLTRGEPALYFGFFESPPRLLQKGDDLGLKLSQQVEKGGLEVIWQPAGELIMDALAERLLDGVRRRKVKRIVIDGLVGFEESVVRPERLSHFFKALTNELRGLGVTSILTEEMRELFGQEIVVPQVGVSGTAENIVVLRQIEIASELKRAIAVMKTRETSHDAMLRELRITDRGLEVGDPFPANGPVLSGGTASAASRLQVPGGRGKG